MYAAVTLGGRPRGIAQGTAVRSPSRDSRAESLGGRQPEFARGRWWNEVPESVRDFRPSRSVTALRQLYAVFVRWIKLFSIFCPNLLSYSMAKLKLHRTRRILFLGFASFHSHKNM
jgi:hypothetical protein